MLARIIPILQIKSSGLYKTKKFKNEKYIGDPINAVKIFNEKEVDELVLINLDASRGVGAIDIPALKEISAEAFIPLSYGGGLREIDVIHELVTSGFERIIVNSALVEKPIFANEIVDRYGKSTLIAGIDVATDWLGRKVVHIKSGMEKTKLNPVDWAKELEFRGVGEIILTSIDRDGEMIGYDYDLIKSVSSAVNIPVIAVGGAANSTDFYNAVKLGGCSGVAAGSFFVFHGKHRAVLISYPNQNEIMKLWASDGKQ